ncbi:MAG: indolepyruvate ferredoxin oxidoreductase family protein [Sphingomonadaceae bacterium]|jgi:indolepyruvate ferredoxin oxidoreductase
MSQNGILSAKDVSLDDKWQVNHGRVLMSGTHAIARVMLAQHDIDQRNGLHTAGYVTGYRGSPLGNVDVTFWSLGERLTEKDIVFQPGVNEDLAATAVRGSQETGLVPGAKYDGVYASWYAKGPGVDRAGDAFKHGNIVGAHKNGGVLIFYGDDHAGKSSTVSHQSEQALAASLIPSLYPSDPQEILEYGLLGYALSRYSGSWVAIKCIGEVAEQMMTVDVDLEAFSPALPEKPATLPDVNAHLRPFNPLGDERTVVEHRLPLVQAFVRANRLDQVRVEAPEPAIGIITSGKSYRDVCGALTLLGLDEESTAAAGISLYKVGCIWPLEPEGIKAFAAKQKLLFFVEEKRSFIEAQAADILFNLPERPQLIGKHDEDGAPLLSSVMPFEAADLALVIAQRLERLGRLDDAMRQGAERLRVATSPANAGLPVRAPYFCSGCPHSRSTRIPDGSMAMTGIGCHVMASFARPETSLPPTQMGAEGSNWIGLAPFTETKHIFQNLGEGTYYHSGLLAIRAAIAANVNITYKILYNDAVAMTGGQPVDGPISVDQIARQVHDEGAKRIVLLSDYPEKHMHNPAIPNYVEIRHRDRIDEVQRELREVPGCTVLIYEQTCAAEKRRRRKIGTFPNPQKRLFIAKEVCEGCGDCSVQSTCVSIVPVETAMGRKRAIDQSSCNKDYSCANGFCPSFITVYGAEPKKPEALTLDESLFSALPEPARAVSPQGSYNILIAGIGGTGVITVGALVAMAAHMEGLAVSSFDMTGLSQKNGAVYSHMRISPIRNQLTTQRLSRGEADLLLAFDLIAGMGGEAVPTLGMGRTRALVNSDTSPTMAFQFNREWRADTRLLFDRLGKSIGAEAVTTTDATKLALAILGDTIGANLFLLGQAVQQGLLPVGPDAIEQAVKLNNVAVQFNLRAFRLGRLHAVEPARVEQLAQSAAPAAPKLPETLEEVIAHRSMHLTAYQDAALAERYRALVDKVRAHEETAMPGQQGLSRIVARNYAKLLAYKDEYEVARLLTRESLAAELASTFAAGGKIALNLAPPFLNGALVNGRPRKKEFGRWIVPLLRVLARMKILRGSALDLFGYTAERRAERAMIAEYEALVEEALAALTPANHAAAMILLNAVDEVRGFGPVKEVAMETYHRRLPELRAALTVTDIKAKAVPLSQHG